MKTFVFGNQCVLRAVFEDLFVTVTSIMAENDILRFPKGTCVGATLPPYATANEIFNNKPVELYYHPMAQRIFVHFVQLLN